ncbi:MAG: SAM-dependent chlorinase/fluorinase [Thermoleophilia bacterium]
MDITHEVKRHHILQGAVILANTMPHMSESVILTVVDPGVGCQQRADLSMGVRAGESRLLPHSGRRRINTATLPDGIRIHADMEERISARGILPETR